MKKLGLVLSLTLGLALVALAPALAQQVAVVTTHPLVGTWNGMWVLSYGGMSVDTTISPSPNKGKLSVLYEYGGTPRGELRPGKLEGEGIVTSDNVLEFTSSKGSRFIFTLLEGGDKLRVNWFPSAGGGRFETTLSRKK